MAVNNSLPVRLSDVIAEFGGGASAPKNLGAYKAGGGYVPAGTQGGSAAIPTPNGLIPSANPLNLGSFPGSKKELTVTQYWPYKGFYMRNYHWWNSAVPALEGRNTDPTNGWNGINGSNANYLNNGVLWQQKKFTGNNTNASLPDSGQCTVIYLVNNGSFSNNLSQGTGLSVRGLDATGVLQHMTPIATGKYNFITSGSSSQLAMSYASYNCSMKKITDIFTSMTDGTYAGTWDMLIILPGLKKVKEAPVTPDDTGYDIKPSAQIAVDEVVLGMRYDGSGNYQIQYQNQTFPNGVRNCGWWYNNGCFDIEANTGTSAQTLTTVVPQDYAPASVWIVMNDQTGTVYGAGINPIWGVWSIGATGGVSASFTVKRNGAITANRGGVNMDIGNGSYTNCPENWFIGTTLTSMPGDNYWVRVTPQSGSIAPSGPNGFVQLSSDQTWSCTSDGSNYIVDIYIADNPAGTNAKYLGYVIMALASSGGGGGGGGGCVEITSYLPNGQRASDMQVGSVMQLADHETLQPDTGEVTYSETKVMPGFRIITESGASLRCSSSAPIPTQAGVYKTPSELHNDKIAVRRDIDGEIQITWEHVVGVESIGEIAVQHITVGERCFWAGEQEGAYILHHNLKMIETQNTAD